MELKKVSGVAVTLIIFLSFIIFVSLLAIVLNANRLLKSKVESHLGKNFSIENISIGWGKVIISNLRVKDTKGREVGKTEAVTVKADYLDFLRKKYTVSEVRVINPYFLIETDSKGKPVFPVMLNDQIKQEKIDEKKGKPEKFPVLVKKAEVVRGSIDYIDRGVKGQPATVKLRNLHLELKNLSYPFVENFVVFSFKAEIPGYDSVARLSGEGKTNIINKDTESRIILRNLDAKILEPYYRNMKGNLKIERGFLDIDLRIDIVSRRINAPCKVVVRDLEFSDTFGLKRRILDESLKAALSLLKNKKGEITLDFVVDGKIDDPDFNLKEAVIKACLRSLGKKIGIFVPNFPGIGTF